MRVVVLLLSAVLASAASGATIEVSPGPGTPLQDGIAAAAPGDRVLIHGGDYLETIVIDKSLRVRADGGVRIGPVVGPQQSSCTPAFIMDVTGGRVTIDAKHGSISAWGGGTAAVRMRGGARVKTTRFFGVTFCPHAAGLHIDDVEWAKLSKGSFSAYSRTLAGGPGCRIAQQAASTVTMTSIRCDATLAAVGNYASGPGLLIDGTSAGASARVKITGGPVLSCGDAGVKLQSAKNVRILRSYLQACPLILGEAPYFSIMLDAASTGNVVQRSQLAGPIQNLGTGNCFRGNVDGNAMPLPDDCS